jgi:hypothetical protein
MYVVLMFDSQLYRIITMTLGVLRKHDSDGIELFGIFWNGDFICEIVLRRNLCD